jgi:hypothetical protein
MAAGDLREDQAALMRLMRDMRPVRIAPHHASVQYRTVRQLARMGYADLRGGPAGWTATITADGLRALDVHHARRVSAKATEK